MNILWMTWKDRKNPLAGGAEVVAHELGKKLAADGHAITFLTSNFMLANGNFAPHKESIDGYNVIRLGTRLSIYWQVFLYYKKKITKLPSTQKPDLIIDEINTIPFFAGLYTKEKTILFIHQLAREIWFYEMFFPLSLIGYLLEPFYLWLLRKHKVITVSKSSKKDIVRFGFNSERVHILTEGIEMEPLLVTSDSSNPISANKYKDLTLLSVGSVRPMKRTLDIIKAFEIAQASIPSLKLIVAGDMSSRYGKKVMAYIQQSVYANSIQCLGKIDFETKKELMMKSHLLCVTSIKEGWGLTVSEAASQGTPTAAYDVEGLRDSVNNLQTGILSKDGSPSELAKNIVDLLKDQPRYETMRQYAWMNSRGLTFERAYQDFKNIIGI